MECVCARAQTTLRCRIPRYVVVARPATIPKDEARVSLQRSISRTRMIEGVEWTYGMCTVCKDVALYVVETLAASLGVISNGCS